MGQFTTNVRSRFEMENQKSESRNIIGCDLCIVGAGISGLNFLYSASQSMSKKNKIVLVDRNPGVGGMWNETYPYVRLHQPHPMFTVGNFSWSLDKDRSHLATREEVIGHFDECIDRLRDRVTLVEHYNYEYQGHEEVRVDGEIRAEARLNPTSSDKPKLLVRSPRLIKAFGMRVPKPKSLNLSSKKVVSISPLELDLLEDKPENTPVYVVGGGKTGIDTVHAVLKRYPDREVNLINGRGTLFWNRNKIFPDGAKRWFGGELATPALLDYALRFNGTNEEEVYEYLKSKETLSLTDNCENFFSGILSEEEKTYILENVNDVIEGYLTEVVDVADRPVMKFRSGAEKTVEPGSFIIGCTGFLLRKNHAYEPYVSETGTTVSIQSRSSVYLYQNFTGYWLGQLLSEGNLMDIPLYTLDNDQLFAKNKKLFTFAWMTQLIYNTILITDAVPARAMKECGLNFDNWYPLYRQLPFLLKLKMKKRSYLMHFRKSLDRVCERTQVRGGPLHVIPDPM